MGFSYFSVKVTTSVVNTVDNLLESIREPSADDHSATSNSTSLIIRSLEKQIEHSLSRNGSFKVVNSSIAVEALRVNQSNIETSRIGFVVMNQIGNDGLLIVKSFTNESTVSNIQVQTSITLPPMLRTDALNDSGKLNVVFLLPGRPTINKYAYECTTKKDLHL